MSEEQFSHIVRRCISLVCSTMMGILYVIPRIKMGGALLRCDALTIYRDNPDYSILSELDAVFNNAF